MPTYPSTMAFRDSKGQTGHLRFYSTAADRATAAASSAAVIAAIQALTVGFVTSAKGPTTLAQPGFAYGASGSSIFGDAEDHAVLTFATSTGAFARVTIPTPQTYVMGADRETVDPLQANVATLIAAMVDGVTSARNGNLFTAFIGGVYRRAKEQRRYNIVTLNPALSQTGL